MIFGFGYELATSRKNVTTRFNFRVDEVTECDSLGSLPVSRDAGIFQQLSNTKLPVRAREFGPPFRITQE